MDFQAELKRRIAAIDEAFGLVQPKPRSRYDWRIKNVPVVKYDLVVRDMTEKVIKELAWGLSFKECVDLAKHYQKSRLIQESEGQYSLHYLKIERGLYQEKYEKELL